jgi:hypothetical protein
MIFTPFDRERIQLDHLHELRFCEELINLGAVADNTRMVARPDWHVKYIEWAQNLNPSTRGLWAIGSHNRDVGRRIALMLTALGLLPDLVLGYQIDSRADLLQIYFSRNPNSATAKWPPDLSSGITEIHGALYMGVLM